MDTILNILNNYLINWSQFNDWWKRVRVASEFARNQYHHDQTSHSYLLYFRLHFFSRILRVQLQLLLGLVHVLLHSLPVNCNVSRVICNLKRTKIARRSDLPRFRGSALRISEDQKAVRYWTWTCPYQTTVVFIVGFTDAMGFTADAVSGHFDSTSLPERGVEELRSWDWIPS